MVMAESSRMDRMMEMKMKIKNYIINFTKSRKIIVRVGTHYSNVHPLENGIPQGSPISVVLFLIAFNKLPNILTIYKQIKFSGYADDFLLLVNLKNKKNITVNLNHLFRKIEDCGSYSGASLSQTKCEHLHICRKRSKQLTQLPSLPISSS